MLAIKIVSHIETRLYGERFWERVEPLSGLNYSICIFPGWVLVGQFTHIVFCPISNNILSDTVFLLKQSRGTADS